MRAVADAPFLDLHNLILGFVSQVLDLVFGSEEGSTGVWHADAIVPERPVRAIELSWPDAFHFNCVGIKDADATHLDILILPDGVPRILFSLLLQNDSGADIGSSQYCNPNGARINQTYSFFRTL